MINGEVVPLFGCKLIRLDKFSDTRGYLVPIWSQEEASPQYAYYSMTYAGQARDPDRWHVHEKQADRFVVLMGNVVFGLSNGQKTEIIALSGRDPQMLVIPPGVYHCLNNRWSKDALLINLPSQIYNPDDEGRIPFNELDTRHPW